MISALSAGISCWYGDLHQYTYAQLVIRNAFLKSNLWSRENEELNKNQLKKVFIGQKKFNHPCNGL